MFTGKSKKGTTAQARYRVLRTVAGATATSMAWLIAGPSVAAGVQMARIPKPQGHTRALNQTEMAHILGAQVEAFGNTGITVQPTHQLSTDQDSGSTYPWEGNVGGANTGNGNKQTELPIVSWKARGGRLGVNLSLFHSSEGNHNSELGHKWTHSYDIYLVPGSNPGDMIIHWGDDLSYPFAQNMNGSFSAPVGIHDTFVQTGSGTSATYDLTTKDQIVYHFAYVSNGNGGGGWYCSSITDRNNNSITLAHNSNGFVTSITDPTSRTITFSYTSGKLTGITDPISRSWTLHYDGNDDLTSVDLPAVGSTVYSMGYGYNANHDITSVTDLRGKVWTKDYFSDNSIKWEKDPLGNQTSYTYASGYTKITDANGHFIKHNYSSGKLASVQDGAGQSDYFTYDTDRNKISITDRRGKVWNYTFDSRGNCLTHTNPLSHTTTFTFNSKNDLTSAVTELGHETDWVYNTAGNVTSMTDPLLHTTSYGYDSYGQVTSVTDALSHTTTTGFDTDGNIASVADALNHSSTYAYDGLGRQVSETDATSKTVSATYDELNRMTSITNPGSRTTTFAYEGGSNLKLSQIDPLSHTKSYTHDDAGRLISITDPNSNTTYFAYDYVGNRTGFTDGNNHTTYYSYTNRNEMASVSYPDSTSETYTYNPVGQAYTKTDSRGVTVTNSFDDGGRLTGTSYNDGVTASVSYSYDDDDHKIGMTDGTGSYSYSYDAASRITQRATPNLTVSFGYDNGSRLTSRTLGTGTTTFSYDSADRLTSLIAPGASASETTGYTYDNAGRKLTTTFANGGVETNSYDSTTGELSSILHQNSASATISSHAYTYRADGRRTGETTADGSVVSYGFDNAGQLTSESKVNASSVTVYSLTYTYDGAGNRETKSDGTNTEYYTYDNANKLTSAGDKTYTHDYAGNVSSVTNTASNVTTNLTWDAESRLTNISDGINVNASYSYNGMGQRITKTDSANNLFNFTQQDDSATSPLLSDGSATYTQGLSLVSEVRNGTSKFYHSDGLGTTRAITGASGATADILSTDSFGNVVSATGSTSTPFGFAGNAGYQTDDDTGLMLLGYRYYDASTGRFLSRDPIRAGSNWYIYCDNDPVNALDPSGLDKFNDRIKDLWRETPGLTQPDPAAPPFLEGTTPGGQPPANPWPVVWPFEGRLTPEGGEVRLSPGGGFPSFPVYRLPYPGERTPTIGSGNPRNEDPPGQVFLPPPTNPVRNPTVGIRGNLPGGGSVVVGPYIDTGGPGNLIPRRVPGGGLIITVPLR